MLSTYRKKQFWECIDNLLSIFSVKLSLSSFQPVTIYVAITMFNAGDNLVRKELSFIFSL